MLEHCSLAVKLRMSDNSLSKILDWGGKAQSYGVYVSKIQAYAEFIDVGDALDPILMEQRQLSWNLQHLTSQSLITESS